MSSASEQLVVGKIGAPHGVKGWVKINSFTQHPQDIFDYLPWQLGNNQTIEVDQWRQQSRGLVAKIIGIDSREAADLIKNLDILVSTSVLPELEDDIYWKDIIGMQVETKQGYQLGVVKQLFETGANDVMIVTANSNDAFAQKERLIPFVYDQVVLEINKDAKTVIVNWDPAF
jgi:16S rRNA processing protein RimM